MKRRRLSIDRPWQAAAVGVVVMTAMIVLIGNFSTIVNITFFCRTPTAEEHEKVPIQLRAILHYATTQDLPQQSPQEIRVTFDVLFSLYPCNFLVFGLGHELMWASLNPNGFTMFLEESPHWVNMMSNESANIKVRAIQYKTHVYEARDLLAHSKFEPNCLPPKVHLKHNDKCRLILKDLPEEVYSKEWDVIMIDGPSGYLPESPGRMAVIFTVSVMARLRTRPGVTHVILHDVNRKVEKIYAERFLCKRRLVKAVDRLWHFVIPPATREEMKKRRRFFC